jgi:hypothetical protein
MDAAFSNKIITRRSDEDMVLNQVSRKPSSATRS